jgi:uncharacterized membrane protein
VNDGERLWNLLEIDQGRISTLDTIAMTIRTWAVTLVSAIIGFSFTEHNKKLLLAAAGASLLFCLLDVRYRTTQLLHASRVDRVEQAIIPTHTLRPRKASSRRALPLMRSPYRSAISFYVVVLVLIALVAGLT